MWSKLPDEFAFDPRVIKAGPEPIALYARALARVAQTLSDGVITRADLQMLCVYEGTCSLSPEEQAAALVRVALWEVFADGWRIVDYLDHNMSAAQFREWRERQAAGGRRGGGTRARTGKRADHGQWAPESIPESTVVLTPDPLPDRPRLRPRSSQRYLVKNDSERDEEWLGWDSTWEPFLAAWRMRFSMPPTPRQREVLWEIKDNRPTDLATWVTAAPKGAKAADVVGYVLRRWQGLKSSA